MIFFLISYSLSHLVENCTIKPGYRPHHSIVLLELKLKPFKRGRGLWKFNKNLLIEYVLKVKETIQSFSSQYLDNIGSFNFQCKHGINESLFLEVFMMEIRGITIPYSAYKKMVKDKAEKVLLQEIEALELNFTIDFHNSDEKNALENLRKEKLQEHIIRPRAYWIEQGEKPSRYFYKLESGNI